MISLGQLLNPQPPLQGLGHGRASAQGTENSLSAGPGNSGQIRSASHVISREDIQSAQITVEHQLKSKMDAQMALVKPQAAELLAPEAAESGFAADDFSPEAVTDRIMGFIESRIEAERANGASEEELQSMFGQALKGLEQGLKEAKEVITSMDMFDGEIKDTFFETVSLIDERMSGLEKTLFGSVDEESEGVGITQPSQPSLEKSLDLDKAFASIPRGNERYSAQSNALFFSQDNQFDMEVVTQDGDVVTLHVGAGESLDFRSGSIATPRGQVSGFELEQTSYYDLSFSVEGDLDEGELAALNDLFSQVNNIADSFYSGDVGGAFEQALAVGYDSEELAAFAVNMTHTEVVAVAQYKEVEAIDQGSSGAEVAENPLQSIMDRLSDFASQVLSAQDLLLDNPNKPSNQQALFADVLSQLVPPGENVGDEDSAEEGAGQAVVIGNQIHDAFKGFIDEVLS